MLCCRCELWCSKEKRRRALQGAEQSSCLGKEGGVIPPSETPPSFQQDMTGAEDAFSCTSDQTVVGCAEPCEVTSEARKGGASAAAAVAPEQEQDGQCAMALSRAQGNQYGALFRDYADPGQWGRDSVEANYRMNHLFQVCRLLRQRSCPM